MNHDQLNPHSIQTGLVERKKSFNRKNCNLPKRTQLEIFIKISGTGKGIRTIFLHHEIQRHLLNQIIYLEYENYLQEKNSFPEVSLFMCFEHPVEYSSTFVREC